MSSINQLVDDDLKKDINQAISHVKIYLRQRFNEGRTQLNNQIKQHQQLKEKEFEQQQLKDKQLNYDSNSDNDKNNISENNNSNIDNKENNNNSNNITTDSFENVPKKTKFCCEHVDNIPEMRTLFFTLTAFFGIIPASHALYLFEWDVGILFFYRINVMFALFGIGLIFYIARIPERWMPGIFDSVSGFGSHAIWHLFTFLAPLYHYHTCKLTFSAAIGQCGL
ncbi:hypothetical protein PPL_04693 [Heterostelium album PN500]|uniref:Uncharacterized protein n=1 Tax=Heterostelium pallidum (strain ATCC 26659 / Pp 5 / PN500) TaxID=670386 RepID=D3B8A2_HETP5|nr:hypothetical protein PPL_04693 [Heterostelium album PN500]EFA82270.1 hypothetical protein PPL_04693 [Heterostelium album PN500]|eukprot:XP_020434387.1 hypothetical protein PPL_04693 [Heterostelium album PN500]